jgi:glycosyltransferase involved in cell wall biosynthesis
VGSDYEIILVNDGSQHGNWAVMSELAASDAHVIAINLTRYYGHEIALTAGLHYTRGKRILIIDADLQDHPELLDQICTRWTKEPTFCTAKVRFDKGRAYVFEMRHVRPCSEPNAQTNVSVAPTPPCDW